MRALRPQRLFVQRPLPLQIDRRGAKADASAGIGIRASALSRIFRAFQRADDSRPDGLGLGLFIVKHAADLLGHRVEVRSIENHGSCFTIVADAAR